MIKANVLIILPLVFFFAAFTAMAQNVCSQKFEVNNVKRDGATGSFNLKIESKDSYDGQLVELMDSGQKVIQSFSGQNDLVKTFKNLKKSEYRVILEFKNEPKFLCKRRILTIDLTDTQ